MCCSIQSEKTKSLEIYDTSFHDKKKYRAVICMIIKLNSVNFK